MNIKLPYIALPFLIVVIFVACSNKNNKTTNNETHLNIGAMSSMDYFPLVVAQDNGYFEKEAVSVTIHKFYSANERDAAFQSGNLDGTILDYTGAAIQRSGGINLKLVSQCEGSFVLIAGKESKIENIEDLKGKRLAVSGNTVIDFCTDLVLQEANMSSNDIDKVEINKIPLRLEMLRNGKIDATMLPDPFATIALQDNNRSIIDIQEMDIHITGIAFHEKVIKQKREAIKSFYRAYNEAVALINSKPASHFHSLLVSDIGVPSEVVSKVKLPNYSSAQTPKDVDLKKVEQWLKSKGLVTSEFNIDTLIESDLIP